MENFDLDPVRPETDNNPPRDTAPETEAIAQPEQPEQTVQPETCYRGSGVGRKESPFADSPYVMHHAPQTPPVPPKKPAKAKKKSRKVLKSLLSAALAVALVVGSCAVTASMVNNRWETQVYHMEQDFNAKLDALQKRIDQVDQDAKDQIIAVNPTSASDMTPRQVYARNVASVVLITCQVTSSSYGQPVTGTSTGSGFILTQDGYIVTNNHVVEGATKVWVTTYDGMEYSARVVGADATNDVGVLKVEAEGLPAVTMGRSGDLVVGDQVVAIGNPLGELTATMTAGYVSAMDRDVTTDGRTINMIQTDAAINSGNSGGPLFNMKGEVVGITTAKYSGSSASGATIEGIGFAIPVDDVMGMVDDLVNYGYVTGAYLGVMVSDMDTAAAAYYGMPVGAYVQEVTPGYCAEAAGIRAKDIIVALGEYQVRNVSELTRALRNFKAGDTTTVTVYRSGVQTVLTITLDEKPRTTESNLPQDGSYEEWYNYFAPFFGQGQAPEQQD